jgi:hypothetical protein
MRIPIEKWSEQDKCLSPINDATGAKIGEVASLYCLPLIIQNAVNVALFFSGFVALFLIIYAGILFITSGGDKAKIEQARKTITYTIIGLIIIIFAWAIIGIINTITGYRP